MVYSIVNFLLRKDQLNLESLYSTIGGANSKGGTSNDSKPGDRQKYADTVEICLDGNIKNMRQLHLISMENMNLNSSTSKPVC